MIKKFENYKNKRPGFYHDNHKDIYYNDITNKPLNGIGQNGTYVIWCKNGKLHREDGPACNFGAGPEWFINGKRHRLDGPAIIHAEYFKPTGRISFYINDVLYTETVWKDKVYEMLLNNPSLLYKMEVNEWTEDIIKKFKEETDYKDLKDEEKDDINDIFNVI
jgi:hypothetical protein